MRFFSIRRGAVLGQAAAAVAMLFVLTHYWHANSASKSAGRRSDAGVPSAVASRGSISATVRLTGTVAALRSATVLAPRIQGSRSGVNRGGSGSVANAAGVVGGGISDFNLVLLHLATPGSRVKAGEVVAEFDAQNQAQRVDDYKDSVVQLDASIRKMAADLASNKEAHTQSVRAAKAAWEQAVQDLRTQNVTDEIDAQLLKLAVEEDEAAYKQLVYEDSLVDEQQRAQIRLSELNRNQAGIELQRAQSNVGKMTLRAPMDGIVVMASIVRNGELGQVREGDQVFAGQPFMYIVDPGAMVLNASLNQVDAERLQVGMTATVHVDTYSDCEMTGKVVGMGAMAQDSTFRASYVGEIPVRIAIDRLDPRIIPDLTGSADVLLASEPDAVVVPRTAVFTEGGAAFVYVKTAAGWERKEVALGVASNTEVAIRSGLREGDVVALGEKPVPPLPI